jgi:hypothetical protein
MHKNDNNVTSLPELKSSSLAGRKNLYLHSLREENNRIRDELKQISKQLSMHINKQLRDKSNFHIDTDKEVKFIEGNILNEHKRLEIVQYEFEHTRYIYSNEGNYEKQTDLKQRLKELSSQISE